MQAVDWRSRTRRIGAATLVTLTFVASALAPTAALAAGPNAGQGVSVAVDDLGTTTLAPSTGSGSTGGSADAVQPDPGRDLPKDTRGGSGGGGGVPTTPPNPRANPVAGRNDGAQGFNALSHLDQRLAGTGAYAGTQFSLEPPDQALCVGNRYVVEAVNNALAVYDTRGNTLSGPTAMSQFFALTPEIDPHHGRHRRIHLGPQVHL